METKVCRICKKEKEISSYHKKKDTYDGLRSDCKECRKEGDKKYYIANKEEINRKGREHSAKKRSTRREEFKQHFGQFVCEECGYSHKCWAAFDLHHLDMREKEFTISHYSYKPWEDIKDEVDKCILLCATCHRIEHYCNE